MVQYFATWDFITLDTNLFKVDEELRAHFLHFETLNLSARTLRTIKGSEMKKMLCIAAAAGCLMTSAAAEAAVFVSTRDLNGGTVDLSITTDGTLGVLSSSNIVDWTITLDEGGDTFILRGPLSGNNSGFLLIGNSLSATSTDLIFNFDLSSILLFQAPSVGSTATYYCLQGTAIDCYDNKGPGEGVRAGTHLLRYAAKSQGGSVLIASVASGAVPEPTTWALMILGFGAIGASIRTRRTAKVSVSYA